MSAYVSNHRERNVSLPGAVNVLVTTTVCGGPAGSVVVL